MMEYKKLYDQLLESGDLFDVFPEAVGEWSKDKKDFIEIQNQMDYNASTYLIIEDEEEQEYFD